MKRTHRKVRSGCDVCRRRRIKCDELKPQCTQCRRWAASRGMPLACQYNIAEAAHAVTRQPPRRSSFGRAAEPTSAMFLSVASQYGWPSQTSDQEMELLYHVCVLRSEMSPAAERGLLAGVNQFSRYLSMAGSFEHLRYTFSSLGASHLRILTHSTGMAEIECYYRLLSIQAMVSELSSIRSQSTSNSMATQALVASATLMAWYSNNPQEYAHLLTGIFALRPAQAHQAATPTTGLPKSQCAMPTRPPPEYTDDPGTLLDETADSLSELSKCKLDADLRAAAKDLSNFIHNVRHLSRDYQSRDDQLCAMFPIRNWLRFVPRAPDKFAAGGDFKLYLYLANYETTMLIMGSILPWVELPLAIPERWTCVEKIREFLQSQVDSIVDGDDIAGAAQTYKAYTNWMGVAEKVMNQHHFD